MNIVVTGSIAFDYLMSFPGKFTEHFLPEHMQRVSLSFLVDTMDKRRGGCAPNIAYTLALLGERPRADGDGRARTSATTGSGSRRPASTRRWCSRVPASSRRRSSAAPTSDNNQIASFYTGAMADAGELSFRDGPGLRAGDHLAERSRRDGAVRRGVPHARHPVHLRSGPAVRADVRRRAARRPRCGARIVICNDYEFELLRQKTGLGEADILAHAGDADRDARRARLVGDHRTAARVDVPAVAAAPDRRSDRRRRRVPGRVHEGAGREARTPRRAAGSAASPRPTRSSILGGTSHAYTWRRVRAAGTRRTLGRLSGL